MSKKNDNNKRKQILITFPDNVSMPEADKYYRGLPSTFVPPPRNNDAVLGVC